MLGSDTYDAIVLGTGLAESIAAAALAKAGHSVLHLDPNDYYGGEAASLTLDELVAWSEQRSAGTGVTPDDAPSAGADANAAHAGPSSEYIHSQTRRYTSARTTGLGTLADDRRRYALTLFPALMVSRGDLVATLIDSDVSKYVGFRLLDGVSVMQDGAPRRVPGAKEDVFKDKSIPLLDKRRLMKALMFAGGEFESDPAMIGHQNDPIQAFLTSTFSLPPHLATAITYAVAHASSPDEPALPALRRARKYLRSIGRYGPSAFLVGQYGGAGEVAQGFCRACAVFGGTYILGSEAVPSEITVGDENVSLRIPAHPEPLVARHLIASPDFLPPALRPETTRTAVTSHAVVVLTKRPAFLSRPKVEAEEGADEDEGEGDTADDTAVLILPDDDGPLVRALVMGEGTGSCPANQWVAYLWTEGEGGVDVLKTRVAEMEGVAFEAYYVRRAEGWGPESDEVGPEPKAEGEAEGKTETGEKETEGETEGQTAAATASHATDTPRAPLVVLNPYAGAHMLTEGLDWEAREGRRAFAAASGRAWFERAEEEEEE